MPLGKPLSIGSKVIVFVCRECGHIFDLQAEKPEKF